MFTFSKDMVCTVSLTSVLNVFPPSRIICKADFRNSKSCMVYILVYKVAVFFLTAFVGALLHFFSWYCCQMFISGKT